MAPRGESARPTDRPTDAGSPGATRSSTRHPSSPVGHAVAVGPTRCQPLRVAAGWPRADADSVPADRRRGGVLGDVQRQPGQVSDAAEARPQVESPEPPNLVAENRELRMSPRN
jgi:hypothetical protein